MKVKGERNPEMECPKCRRRGTRIIYSRPKGSYLRVYHSQDRTTCNIGYVRTMADLEKKINRPASVEEYQNVVGQLVVFTKTLKDSDRRGNTIHRDLKRFFEQYGLWEDSDAPQVEVRAVAL